MPVTAPQPPPTPPCLHCQECGRRECCLVFRVQLDADLLHTLVSIYPEWFAPNMQPVSPPKAEVDDSPLHNSMDKNKESLKVKLMLRRPINQLVAQGIMPPLKTPPGFHEQRQKLERAKMGDLLKAKIQQRPDRQELVRQHILEDVGHVDPSLAERQRQLKKCRLADALNDQLSHRPGPLELIKKNILHTEEPIERAVKEGHIEFKATSEGQSTKPTPPDHYMLDEDSSSGGSPPREMGAGGGSSSMLGLSAAAADVVSSSTGEGGGGGGGGSVVAVLFTPTTAIALRTSSNATVYSATAPSPSTSASTGSAPSTPRPSPAPGKEKNRKKSKAKAQPKARTIKFHEYKGPPNAQKTSSQSSSTVETPYELLLQQQQLFLQWQLEWQHKYPQILLPASQKPSAETSSSGSLSGSPAPPPPPLPQSPPPPPPALPLRNLEDMKVSDLKAELKRRNLPVSGAKPQLIERLKPFSESAQNSISTSTSNPQGSSSLQEDSAAINGIQSVNSGDLDISSPMPGTPPSPCSGLTVSTPATPAPVVSMDTNDYHEGIIIREQQRKIDQLQRLLMNSQLQLQNTFQQQQQQSTTSTKIVNSGGPQQQMSAKASLAAFLQQQQLNQALLQQQQQQQSTEVNGNNNNNNETTVVVIGTGGGGGHKQRTPSITDQQTLQNHINLTKGNHQRTGSLPNFVGTFGSNDLNQTDITAFIDTKPLFLETKPEIKTEVEHVKSQIVDDVLEILIKNGELPASAAEGIDPDLGLEMEQVMEVDQELMDVDTDWLDSLMESTTHNGIIGGGGMMGVVGGDSDGRSILGLGDPLLAPPASPSDQPPFMDLFMDDTDLKIPNAEFVWDRIDFAT